MKEANSKIGFWEFPITLKFVVMWTGFLGLSRILEFIWEISNFPTDHNLDFGPFVNAIVSFILVYGLINKRNSSRIWTSIFYGIGLLAMVTIIGWVIFKIPPDASLVYEIFNYYIPMTEFQMIGFYSLFIVIHAITLYVLLRPSTKALFSPQSIPPTETTSKEAK